MSRAKSMLENQRTTCHGKNAHASTVSSFCFAKKDGPLTCWPPSRKFLKAASASTLCLFRHSASSLLGKSPILPDGWYAYRKANCRGKITYCRTEEKRKVITDLMLEPFPS